MKLNKGMHVRTVPFTRHVYRAPEGLRLYADPRWAAEVEQPAVTGTIVDIYDNDPFPTTYVIRDDAKFDHIEVTADEIVEVL